MRYFSPTTASLFSTAPGISIVRVKEANGSGPPEDSGAAQLPQNFESSLFSA
jgi:hypothetical protein